MCQLYYKINEIIFCLFVLSWLDFHFSYLTNFVLLYFFAHDGCYEGCPIVKQLRKCNSDQKKNLIYGFIAGYSFFLVWPFINSKTRTKFVILKKVSMYIVHVHQFNETLRSDLKGELYPVKSIHNYIGCHLKFFRTASAQIFFQGIFFLMLSLRSFK